MAIWRFGRESHSLSVLSCLVAVAPVPCPRPVCRLIAAGLLDCAAGRSCERCARGTLARAGSYLHDRLAPTASGGVNTGHDYRSVGAGASGAGICTRLLSNSTQTAI